MKKAETDPSKLTREVKIAMLRALETGKLNESNRAIINGFINGTIEVEIIDNPLQVDSLTDDEFETVVQRIRRDRYSGVI